jgi:hypothetical protein
MGAREEEEEFEGAASGGGLTVIGDGERESASSGAEAQLSPSS